MTQAFINKYNIYINSFSQIRIFINNNLKNNLAKKYKKVINDIRTLLQKIKSNSVIKKYYSQLYFSDEHLRQIKDLLEKFDKYISDQLYNNNYLPEIKKYIDSVNVNLNQIEENLKNLYYSVSNLPYSSSVEYDYFKYLTHCWKCCKFKLGVCWKYKTCCESYYQGYSLGENNIILETINFDEYTQNFDKYYNEIYEKSSNYVNSYNIFLMDLNTSLEAKKQELLNRNNKYLNEINDRINYIINNLLGINLLVSAYDYFKNDINNKLPSELNEILEQWKTLYEQIYEELSSNLNAFKSSFNEIYLLTGIYLDIYYQNITISHIDSIVDQYKNDLNYTIKYYYNIISSKISKVFSNILNNLPLINEPFDDILSLRENEIRLLYNNFINKIILSKNEILQSRKQLSELKVNDKDFFNVNSYIVKNVQDIQEQLYVKIAKIGTLANNNIKEATEELIVSRFYLENSQNGKQILDNYEPVNQATFIDLQKDVCKQLFQKFWEINQDEFINNIKNILKKSNETLLNSFKYENEKYATLLRNKIEKEIYTEEELYRQINNFYTNGLNNLDINSKNIIYEYLNEIINKIKSIISNEISIISDELTSYSKNCSLLNNTINNYKQTIYNNFYSNIVSLVNEFYTNLNKKFYEDYILYYLVTFQNMINEEKFQESTILNMSFNLNDIINANITEFINKYKTRVKSEIDSLNQKYINQLDELFIFSNMKNEINNKLNNLYSDLCQTLQQNDNSGHDKVIDYDLPNQADINIFIDEKIKLTKKEIQKMKGNNYIIEYERKNINFNSSKQEVFNLIKEYFKNFTEAYQIKEENEFNNKISENIKNNFKIITDNFIPSFAKDFFDRIIYYNQLQKIKALYNNLKYSLTISNAYYIILGKIYSPDQAPINLPEDIKIKILTLNNLDSTVKAKNAQVISSLQSKLDEFFNETISYSVEKYISDMQNNLDIKFSFSDRIVIFINNILNITKKSLINEYNYYINNYIKIPFKEQYINTINKETSDMINFIEKNRQEIRLQLNKIFTLNVDTILSDIDKKLDNTKKAVLAYKSYFETFKISPEINKFLINFGKEIIYPKYKDIKGKLDNITSHIKMENIEINCELFEKEYTFTKFENKVNEININLSYDFNEMNKSLINYGTTYNVYEKNLKKEISNYERIRILDDSNNEKTAYKQKVADLKLDQTFYELKKSSESLILFIETLNLFSDFEEKINKYINDINYKSIISENLIIKYDEDYKELNSRLRKLTNLSLEYYSKASAIYNSMKDSIFNSIFKIEELLDNCSNITFEVIANKYDEIINDFISINETFYKEEDDQIIIDDYSKNNFIIKALIGKNIIESQFILEIIYEEEEIKIPKIRGKIINKNKPKEFQIDFYSKTGPFCGKLGRVISPEFNDISLSTDIYFDSRLNEAIINTTLFYDQYNVRTKFYENKEYTDEIIINGIKIKILKYCTSIDLEKPENENELSIIGPKMKNKLKIIEYNNN